MRTYFVINSEQIKKTRNNNLHRFKTKLLCFRGFRVKIKFEARAIHVYFVNQVLVPLSAPY